MKPIRSERDYEAALREVGRLWGAKAGTRDGDRLDLLATLIDRFGVSDDFTRRRLQQTLSQDLGRLHLVPAHIEEFVKAGIKRARLARRTPEYLEPGVEATKSIATMKPST